MKQEFNWMVGSIHFYGLESESEMNRAVKFSQEFSRIDCIHCILYVNVYLYFLRYFGWFGWLTCLKKLYILYHSFYKSYRIESGVNIESEKEEDERSIMNHDHELGSTHY